MSLAAALIVLAAVGLFLIATAGIAGSLATIADELRRLNEHMEDPHV